MRVRQEVQALSRQAWLSTVSADGLASPILILGAPRSGTTWLAKIVDSHPDVLYRHEPDAIVPPPVPLTPDALPALLARWAAGTGARAVTKRPYFRKSWQFGWALGLRSFFAAAVSAAGRLPLGSAGGWRIPDFAARPAPRLAIKSIDWAEGAVVLPVTLPASRTIFILRHPCGQVASVMRGNRLQRFDLKTSGTDMPFNQARAQRFAGLDQPAFEALPDAAKYAWSWRAFNEPAYTALAAQPNVYVVLYETLCAQPERQARRIFSFAGLDWCQQTGDFIARSTRHPGEAGYYAVFRDAMAAADNWRSTMSAVDQAAVGSVVAASPLARFWPDLMMMGA